MTSQKVSAYAQGCPPDTLLAIFSKAPSALWPDHSHSPPAKRQKLERAGRAAGSSCMERNQCDITLARIDIDLLFSENSLSISYGSNATAPEQSIVSEVLLQRIDEIETNNFHLRLATLQGACILAVEVQSEKMPVVVEDLRRVITLSPPERQRQNTRLSGVTRSECLLYLSNTAGTLQFSVQARLLWRDGAALPGKIALQEANLLAMYFPDDRTPDDCTTMTPQDFYNSVHTPARSEDGLSPDELPQLLCRLYPFQGRAVRWLLHREGVHMSGNRIMPYEAPIRTGDLPHQFSQRCDADGRDCFVSHLLGIVTTDVSSYSDPASDIRGGILAEEMGLGKTVELITLITLHKPAPMTAGRVRDEGLHTRLRPASATLIITPPSILQQWKQELAAHAPSLKVLHYDGLRIGHGTMHNEDLVVKLLAQDVVLTTYNVLASEVHCTGPKPDRTLRHEKRYESRRSPLVQIYWWRVCLDEAQMVENGVSNAAMVARCLPRYNAWAVSGTPVRRGLRDLFGLLLFLRYEPYCQSTLLWNKLVTAHQAAFQEIVSRIALRHTKNQVRAEIRIPNQKRVVINVPFTPVEEQHYAHLFQQMCDDCNLSLDGNPLRSDWNPDCPTIIEKMKTWLTRLRQTCLHPEVGARNRRALGSGNGPLRTVDEVLNLMIEQNENSIRVEERGVVMSQIRRGQILESAKQNQAALDIWLRALQQSRKIVRECRLQNAAEINKHELRLEQPASLRHIGVHKQRLRSALELEHACTFFEASAYYQIRSDNDITPPDSSRHEQLQEAEERAYERAKKLRAELLADGYRRARGSMNSVERNVENSQLMIPEISFATGQGGIESRKVVARADELCNALNQQREQLNIWREKMATLLLQPLVDAEETLELKGDEYETSTKQQDEIYVYMEALGAVVSDRHDALTGQKNGRVDHEVKVSLQMAASGEGHCPDLTLKLLEARSAFRPHEELGSIRGGIAELRAIRTTLEGGNTRAIGELAIVEKLLEILHRIFNEQTKAVAALLKELDVFRDTMNSRLEFYRQLQQISDSVAPYEGRSEHDPTPSILSRMETIEEESSVKIAALKAKGRYLMHLRTESRRENTQRICVICQHAFEVGALTVCGHQYCKECMKLWFSEHRSCPICKRRLKRNELHPITYKPQGLTIHEEEHRPESEKLTESGQASIYSDISDSTLVQIKNIDLDGSFGTKIDTLARHILWIRQHDPGSKSIVFSQYKDFLDVLARAFAQFRIGFTGIDRKGGTERFKNDPGVECFLLHAKAHSSGLNLVNATHVFLCEPLINPAIELQAIARVHRIGQYRPTTVWMYLVNGTVEESIYDISVSRRMLHVSREGPQASATELLEETIEAANSLELQRAPLSKLLTKGSSGGEVVDKEDLWDCLFRNAKKGAINSVGRARQ